MVGIIENQSFIEGKILNIPPNPDDRGFYQVRVQLDASGDVEGFPNLARADEGTEIMVKVSPRQLQALSLQDEKAISWKIRKAFGQVYFLMGNR